MSEKYCLKQTSLEYISKREQLSVTVPAFVNCQES
nr:MAG TPA: hypothetical protein [Caudoviricetes sp.]